MKSRHLCVYICIMSVSVLLPATGNAVTTDWTNGAGGSFSTSANWSNGVPGHADDAVFDVGLHVYTVTFLGGFRGFPAPVYTTDKVLVGYDDVTFSRGAGSVNPQFIAASTALDPTSQRGIVIGLSFDDFGSLTTNIPVTAVSASIGDAPGASGRLHVTSATTVTITSNSVTGYALVVGHGGSGTLTIDNGALLNVSGNDSRVGVGDEPDVTGEIDISGTGSKLSMAGPFFNVGDRGTGFVSITAGGALDANSTSLGRSDGGYGAVSVDGAGSVFTTRGFLTVGSGIEGVVAQGLLAVTNGAAADIGGPLTISSMGQLTGNSIIVAPSVENSGIVSPGNGLAAPLGILNIDGVFTQTATGHLQIQIISLSSGSVNDQLRSSGAIHLGGTLDVTLLPGSTPAAGNFYDLLDGTTIDGRFASINLPALPSGLMWNATQLTVTGVLSVQAVGDYNGNGVVDAADYVAYRASLGQSGTALAADGNGNGRIDDGDYDVWRAHFGKLNAAAAAVPESSSIWLLLLGITAFSMLRRSE